MIQWLMCNPFTVHILTLHIFSLFNTLYILFLILFIFFLQVLHVQTCCCNIANVPIVGLRKDNLIFYHIYMHKIILGYHNIFHITQR